MMEVPSTEWRETLPRHPERAAPVEAKWRKLPGRVEHTFTHFHLELDVLRATSLQDGALRDGGDYRWVAPEALRGEALPTVMRKVVSLAQVPAVPLRRADK